MIRPFTAVISNNIYGVNNHMGERLGNNIKIPKDFLDKIYSHPITAFAFKIHRNMDNKYNDINPKFSKHDIIRALDFWIEHWVYQNQCEAAFTDTVNVDHEITLKELILVRESIMQMSADTMFTREKIKEPSAEQIRKQKKVVFTEAVYCEDSSLDPFCHRVFELTPEEYIKYKNKPYATGTIKYNFQENFTGTNRFAFSEEFLLGVNQAGGAIFNAISAAMASVEGSMADLTDSLSRIAPITAPGGGWTTIRPIREERFQTGDSIVWDNNTRRFRRATDDDSPQDRILLSTETQTEEFIRWVTTGTFVVPENTSLEIGDTMSIDNTQRNIRMVNGEVAEPINPGDIVALDGNGQWRKVHMTGMNFPVQVSRRLHNNIPSNIEDTITYENMSSIVNGQPVMTDSNIFMTIPVSFTGNGVEINADILLQSGDMMDKLTSWHNHRIQIRPGQRNFLEIDGEEYHCVNMSISHNPSMPLSGMIFRDLIKISTETTVGRIVSMEVNFGAHIGITQCEIYLKIDNPDGGGLMNDRSFRQWDLEILGNNRVRIGNHDYSVTEPIQINMR